MKFQDRELFETVDPPPGGLARLRARMEEPKRAPLAIFAIAGAIALAALLVASIPTQARPRADLLAALREVQREPVALGEGQLAALERLPSSNPQILVYRIAIADASSTPRQIGGPAEAERSEKP